MSPLKKYMVEVSPLGDTTFFVPFEYSNTLEPSSSSLNDLTYEMKAIINKKSKGDRISSKVYHRVLA